MPHSENALVRKLSNFIRLSPGELDCLMQLQSARESVEDYVRLIRDNPRYAGAMNTGSDVQAFANALQRGGYATDPDYAHKLSAVAAEVRQRIAANEFKSASPEPIPAQGPLRKSING